MEEPTTAAAKTPVIVLRVVVNAPDLDAFITRYSKHLTGDRIFIFTKTPQKVGTRAKFSLHLKDGEPLIHGKGTVTRVQVAGDPRHPPGMELVFVTLDERSQTLVDFMHATRLGAVEAMAPAARAVVPAKPVLGRANAAEDIAPVDAAGGAPGAPPPIPMDASSPPVASSEVVGTSPETSAAWRADPVTGPMLEAAYREREAQAEEAKKPEPVVAPWLVSRGPKAKLTPFEREDAEQRRAATAALLKDASRPPSYLGAAKKAEAEVEAEAAAAEKTETGTDTGSGETEANGEAEWAAVGAQKSDVAVKLAEAMAPFAGNSEPLVLGPAPVVAEAWREPLAPGAPAVAPEGVPANPFSDVTDGAIDYFVEWSLEQSKGPRSEPSSKFSNVSMSLPALSDAEARGAAATDYDDDGLAVPRKARPAWMLLGAGALGGIPVGALLVWGLMGSAKVPVATVPAPVPVVVAAPVAAAQSEENEDENEKAANANGKAANANGKTATANANEKAEGGAVVGAGALVVTTRPAGATVTVDGKIAGQSPVSVSLGRGAHEVVIAKDRYATVTQSARAPGAIDLDLRRPALALQVTSTPSGAPVMVAGLARGKTPVTLKLPGYEKYEVQVSMPYTDVWRRSVYLKPPMTSVNAALIMKKQPAARKR